MSKEKSHALIVTEENEVRKVDVGEINNFTVPIGRDESFIRNKHVEIKQAKGSPKTAILLALGSKYSRKQYLSISFLSFLKIFNDKIFHLYKPFI